jgi:hypothetical protein
MRRPPDIAAARGPEKSNSNSNNKINGQQNDDADLADQADRICRSSNTRAGNECER